MSGIHVGGVLVHARPECLERVRMQLESAPGIEVFAETPEGRLVTVIERPTTDELADAFTDTQNMAGVLSASLVYHYSDAQDAGEQETTS